MADFKCETSFTPSNICFTHVRILGADGNYYEWNGERATSVTFERRVSVEAKKGNGQ